MKKRIFKVMSIAPVCVDYDDGRSISYQKGQAFEASPLSPQIARMLRNKQIREVDRFERVEIAQNLGYSPEEQSQLKAREARKQRMRDQAAAQQKQAENQKKVEIASPLTQRLGDAVPAPKKSK